MLGLAGVTAIDCRAAGVTVSTVEPLTPLSVALIVEVPGATPVARPAAVIVATGGVAEAQVTWLVRFCVVLSVKVPVAVNCCVAPLGDARVGRRHRDRLQGRGACTVSTVEPVNAVQRGGDGRRTRRHRGRQTRRR